MDNKFAGRNDNQSGQRFLDSSAPRLIQQVASCETAGGDDAPLAGAAFPPAGKDQKLSWGLGGKAPDVSGVSPDGLSLLDEVQINRDRPAGLKRFCGAYTARGVSNSHPGKTQFYTIRCKCWGCPVCGPRRAARYAIQIRKAAQRLGLKTLLTLTLDPSKLHGEESTKYINEVFADFRVYLRRKLGYAPVYIRVLEYQKNGNAHLHILLSCYLEQAWISETWSALGGGRIVDIRRVDMHRVSHYLSKYLTKDMLMEAPKRARRVTTSKGIRLLEKQPFDFEWRIMRIPILRIFDVYRQHVQSTKQDTDGYLISFETFEEQTGAPPGTCS
jgi:hypothetical protein